jgi:hypothetical protein
MNHHSFSVSPGLAPGRARPSPREGAWVTLRAEPVFDQATRFRTGYSLHMPSQGRALPGTDPRGRAKPRCWSEGPAPHTPRDIFEKKKAVGL